MCVCGCVFVCLCLQTVVAGTLPKYRGLVGTMTLVAREEGVRALWKGLVPRLARVAPGQAITWTGEAASYAR